MISLVQVTLLIADSCLSANSDSIFRDTCVVFMLSLSGCTCERVCPMAWDVKFMDFTIGLLEKKSIRVAIKKIYNPDFRALSFFADTIVVNMKIASLLLTHKG